MQGGSARQAEAGSGGSRLELGDLDAQMAQLAQENEPGRGNRGEAADAGAAGLKQLLDRLHDAVLRNDADQVEEILKQLFDRLYDAVGRNAAVEVEDILRRCSPAQCRNVVHRDVDGKTLLRIAVESRFVGVVRHLLGSGANRWVAMPDGSTPVSSAFVGGLIEFDVIKALDLQPDECQRKRVEPLELARRAGDAKVVRYLLDRGFAWSDSSSAPVRMAEAVRDGFHELCRLYLEVGESVNVADAEGRSLLYLAAASGQVPVVNVLLNFNHSLTPEGPSPLRVAVERAATDDGAVDVLSLLLARGGATTAAVDALFRGPERGEFLRVVQATLAALADPTTEARRNVRGRLFEATRTHRAEGVHAPLQAERDRPDMRLHEEEDEQGLRTLNRLERDETARLRQRDREMARLRQRDRREPDDVDELVRVKRRRLEDHTAEVMQHAQANDTHPRITCPVCYETYQATAVELVELARCHHKLCLRCAVELCHTKWDLCCVECREPVETRQLKHVLDAAHVAEIEQLRANNVPPIIVGCADCGTIKVRSVNLQHTPTTCSADQTEEFHCGCLWRIRTGRDRAWAPFEPETDGEVRTCPNSSCGAHIMHGGGCDSMRCGSCSTEFNWSRATTALDRLSGGDGSSGSSGNSRSSSSSGSSGGRGSSSGGGRGSSSGAVADGLTEEEAIQAYIDSLENWR